MKQGLVLAREKLDLSGAKERKGLFALLGDSTDRKKVNYVYSKTDDDGYTRMYLGDCD